MNLYTRRKALRLLAASGTGAFAASHLRFLADHGRAASLQMSQGGELDFSLAAETGRFSLAGRRATLYGYNGSVPGPRLETRPGDQVRIRFTNRLPEATNLHFHGLHVSPGGNADNVFLEIPPGESQSYEFPFRRVIVVGPLVSPPHTPSNCSPALGWPRGPANRALG